MTVTEIEHIGRRMLDLTFENTSAARQHILVGKIESMQGPDAYARFVRSKVGNTNPYSDKLIAAHESSRGIISGRTEYHLVRLLTKNRSLVEQQFGQDFIDHAPTIYEKLYAINPAKAMTIDKQIAGESTNVLVWWTLAPYIYRQLRMQNHDAPLALEKLLDWMYTAPQQDLDGKVTLSGVEWLPTSNLFSLEDNVQDIDGIPRIVKKGIISTVTETGIKVTRFPDGAYVQTDSDNILPTDGFSQIAPGATVILLEQGEIPISKTHSLARDIAQLVVPQLLGT